MGPGLLIRTARRRITGVRRKCVEHSLAAQEELAAAAGHEPWGLRVLRFNIERHRLELAARAGAPSGSGLESALSPLLTPGATR